MKYFIKVITGFRDDQFVTIPMQEAHKAYYLFKHKEVSGVFDNGVALIGRNIQQIVPDYNSTMGWNPAHKLSTEDWADLRRCGVDSKMNFLLQKAKDVAVLIEDRSEVMKMSLSEALVSLPENKNALSGALKELSDKFKI